MERHRVRPTHLSRKGSCQPHPTGNEDSARHTGRHRQGSRRHGKCQDRERARGICHGTPEDAAGLAPSHRTAGRNTRSNHCQAFLVQTRIHPRIPELFSHKPGHARVLDGPVLHHGAWNKHHTSAIVKNPPPQIPVLATHKVGVKPAHRHHGRPPICYVRRDEPTVGEPGIQVLEDGDHRPPSSVPERPPDSSDFRRIHERPRQAKQPIPIRHTISIRERNHVASRCIDADIAGVGTPCAAI